MPRWKTGGVFFAPMGPNQVLLLVAAGFYTPLVVALALRRRSSVDMILLCLLTLLPALAINYAYPPAGTIAFSVVHAGMAVPLGVSVIRWAFGRRDTEGHAKSGRPT